LGNESAVVNLPKAWQGDKTSKKHGFLTGGKGTIAGRISKGLKNLPGNFFKLDLQDIITLKVITGRTGALLGRNVFIIASATEEAKSEFYRDLYNSQPTKEDFARWESTAKVFEKSDAAINKANAVLHEQKSAFVRFERTGELTPGQNTLRGFKMATMNLGGAFVSGGFVETTEDIANNYNGSWDFVTI
jgi:CO dehydrogenase/acetyl-CoA synthase beta subunit